MPKIHALSKIFLETLLFGDLGYRPEEGRGAGTYAWPPSTYFGRRTRLALRFIHTHTLATKGMWHWFYSWGATYEALVPPLGSHQGYVALGLPLGSHQGYEALVLPLGSHQGRLCGIESTPGKPPRACGVGSIPGKPPRA